MTLDATEVRAGVTGHIYKAPVGTTMPTDVTTGLAVDWIELGYTETGPSKSVDTSKESFTAWQAQLPVRELVTGQTVTQTFNLMQRNADTLKMAWGGGTITGATTKIFTPPATATVQEAAIVAEIIDGDIIDRYCIPRVSITLSGEVSFVKDAPTMFPIELMYLQPASGSPWHLLTNDDNVEADA